MLKASQCYRRKCSIPCRCEWDGGTSSSRIIDLSFDGVLIAQDTPTPELGSKIVVELEIGPKSLPFPGEVVYTQPQEGKTGAFGVHFTSDCEDNLGKLMPLYESYLR
jgi:hypothetical protein